MTVEAGQQYINIHNGCICTVQYNRFSSVMVKYDALPGYPPSAYYHKTFKKNWRLIDNKGDQLCT